MPNFSKRYLPLAVILTVAALPAAQILAFAWTRHDVSAASLEDLSRLFWLNLLLEVAILAAGGLCVGWLIRRQREAERRRKRSDYLAQVGLLAGGLAHEMRNYLNAIHTQIALLRKLTGPEQEGHVQRIYKLEGAVVALEELLTDFLTFARPIEDHLEAIAPADLLQEVVDFLALDLEREKIEVRLDVPGDVPPVIADRAKLKRVVLNLLINARQAMPDGGRIDIRARRSRGAVVMEVQDTGCGIPEEHQPRVFDTFFSTKAEGTGLGLAIVKRTIEDFGGEITFRSTPGRGTSFQIRLPGADRRHNVPQGRFKS